MSMDKPICFFYLCWREDDGRLRYLLELDREGVRHLASILVEAWEQLPASAVAHRRFFKGLIAKFFQLLPGYRNMQSTDGAAEVQSEFVAAHLREFLVAHAVDADIHDFSVGAWVVPHIPAEELVEGQLGRRAVRRSA